MCFFFEMSLEYFIEMHILDIGNVYKKMSVENWRVRKKKAENFQNTRPDLLSTQ